ncbi:MAG: sensor histidine kinase [Gemmatimonadaceae bacterium]
MAGRPSGASVRLRALAALSGSLTDALDPAQAASLVEQEALSALGATTAVVVTLGRFPPEPTPPTKAGALPSEPPDSLLTVLHAIGLHDDIRQALDGLPLDAPEPLAEVARVGLPIFLPGPAELLRYPVWGDAMVRTGAASSAIVPVWANGELRGVLGLAWPDPHIFDEDERAFVLTLGVMCAQAIMRSHLSLAQGVAREAAEHANRSKMHFLATISHELRTPMNAVMGYTDLMAEGIDGPVSDVQRDHLARMHASGKHLLGLIEELLSYARIEAGEAVVNPEPVLLSEVLEESLVLVQPELERKGLGIHVEQPAPPVELLTDRRKLRQILVNLLANAAKFTTTGGVVLLVSIAGIAPAVRVVFEVTDTGRGIGSAQQARIFDPFYREDADGGSSSTGTGLGLSVARQLARLLGGDLLLGSSMVGVGTTFVVTLPLRYGDTSVPPITGPNGDGAAAAPAAGSASEA